ncbi:MAG: bifunctional phosphopantothenoylcysteine decarboxylase/phosphopantothenate--cysteine ligase CoaBC [Pseudohongiellaceae bacterium]|jgi:phosphopantothenoylcysteine decarboxylase/phosphopantothenate--cysteine ligase|nr:bifunctional phosphopantothenoylcysteine decarboxylase/phosphopantothenate--cysteine ligase CoaBC [Gammaproteobacteria bacterium]
MLSLTNKHILLGITGGIAAYKSAELTRLLVKAGAEVHVAMTPSATEFITPLTLQALSGNRVHLDLLDAEAEAGMGHIELARWADLIVIAPATADFMARMTHGQADDLLTAVILASTAQIAIAPAMNQAMWADGITQSNLEALQLRRIHVWGPASGEQACGDVGPGRMIEPQEIADRCAGMFETTRLTGKKVLITGGPTREAIDPVRFISNHSSGKMAFALATEAAAAGAQVSLVSGPVHLPTPDRVGRTDVESAEQMLEAVMERVADTDIFIGVAAVADYRPATIEAQKIKKNADSMTLALVKNPDIISRVAALTDGPMVVGFAAETEHLEANGTEKLKRKGLDLLFANKATETFNSDEVTVTALSGHSQQTLGPGSKLNIARLMLDLIAEHLEQKTMPSDT